MSTRVLWIDTLKAFAIFTVVAGHMMSCGAFESNVGKEVYQEFIMAFHMPLFTVLSGWFFSARRSAMEFLRAKCIGILLPYVVWCFVWFFARPFVTLMMAEQEVHMSSIVWQAKFLMSDGLMCYGWWFLRGLFLTLLLAYVSVKVAEHCGNSIAKNSYAWGGLVSCIGLYILCFIGIIPNQPEKDSLLKGFIFMYPFFWAGYLMRWCFERNQDVFRSTKCLCFVWILFSGLLLLWDGAEDTFYGMNTSAMELTGASGIVGWEVVSRTVFRFVVGAVGAMSFIMLFCKLFDAEIGSKFRVFCQNIGKETLGIYILQSIVYWSLPNQDILGYGNWGNFLFSVVVSVVIIVASYYIINITSGLKWLGLILWGKQRA